MSHWRSVPCLVLLGLLPSALGHAAIPASGPARRFALVVGANRGPADRVPLRYAVADAERFADVVTRMGGVEAGDRVVLRDPTRQALVDALTTTRDRVGGARAESPRVEVIVYFSGHADDRGLMLGREVLPYRELRLAIDAIRADVGITILDACASGAITRLKGGRTLPAFLTDSSEEAQGYAFLTSSTETEAAQESERLGGSFFTQALVTGMRGAADASGDGRVTLNEAYQFAFQETLSQTTTTEAGAQHPTYDIKMAGTGDVVMTDVRQTSSSLVLSPDDEGRFFILGPGRQMVAELYKPQGRQVELGLEPGEYEVYLEQDKQLLFTSMQLADGQRKGVVRSDMRKARRLPTRLRGGAGPADLLDGRVRFELSSGPLTALYWPRPKVALLASYTYEPLRGLYGGLQVGARYYPSRFGQVRPHFGLAAGAFGFQERPYNPYLVYAPGGTRFGWSLDLGLDVYLGRHLTLSMNSDANFANYGGYHSEVAVRLGVGWTFGGKARKPPAP
jgi:hypothetical protein